MARWQTANYTRYHGLLKGLAQSGHNAIVLQPPRLDSAETNFFEVNNEVPAGISVIEIRVPDWLWRSSLPLEKLVKKGSYSLMTQRYLKELIHTHEIDVLILYNLPQCMMLFNAPCFSVFDVADDLMAMFNHELGKASSFGLVHLGRKDVSLYAATKRSQFRCLSRTATADRGANDVAAQRQPTSMRLQDLADDATPG